MGTEPYLIASVLRGVVAQRLVRTICPRCRRPVTPGPEESRLLKLGGTPAGSVYSGEGCKFCDNSGFSGRTLIAELFAVDPRVEELILNRENRTALSAYLRNRGMRTLQEEGLRKAIEGITTLKEVEREIIISQGEGSWM